MARDEMQLTRKVIRIGVVDDHPLYRRGLRATLDREPDLALVGEADNAATALALANETPLDVLNRPGFPGGS